MYHNGLRKSILGFQTLFPLLLLEACYAAVITLVTLVNLARTPLTITIQWDGTESLTVTPEASWLVSCATLGSTSPLIS